MKLRCGKKYDPSEINWPALIYKHQLRCSISLLRPIRSLQPHEYQTHSHLIIHTRINPKSSKNNNNNNNQNPFLSYHRGRIRTTFHIDGPINQLFLEHIRNDLKTHGIFSHIYKPPIKNIA